MCVFVKVDYPLIGEITLTEFNHIFINYEDSFCSILSHNVCWNYGGGRGFQLLSGFLLDNHYHCRKILREQTEGLKAESCDTQMLENTCTVNS